MSLRTRLTMLLAVFGVYAVAAAAVTIYGNQWRLEQSAERFQRIAGEAGRIEELDLLLTKQAFLLRQLATGQSSAMPAYAAAREDWVSSLAQSMAFSALLEDHEPWSALRRRAEALEAASNRCLALVEERRFADAVRLVEEELEGQVVPALGGLLAGMRTSLAEARDRSARSLALTSSRMLALTVSVGACAGLLVLLGGWLVRRWLIAPIAHLAAATREFRHGHFAYRTKLAGGDELGDLARALNDMAAAVSASQRKHHTLFSNLRDAVVICNRNGEIIEYHDGATGILGVEDGRHGGRHFLQVWPEWNKAFSDWSQVIRAAADDGRRMKAHDVPLAGAGGEHAGPIAEFVVYRVECPEGACAAIVVRDVTERHQLQGRLRQAETMEAVGTMAGGLAHDVNNLLSSVTGTLSSLVNDLPDAEHRRRVKLALRACRRAGGLSKRLLDFARGVRGHPQLFAPAPVVDTIIDSIDLPSVPGLTVRRELDPTLRVRMDQDQFAQIVLNLLRNAQEAISESGQIDVRLEQARARRPDGGEAEQSFVVLHIRDTGGGLPPGVESRVFEPFFTTKTRAGGRGRGMGLAIVYASASRAGGFVRIEREPEQGTSVRVFLPGADTDVERAGATADVQSVSP